MQGLIAKLLLWFGGSAIQKVMSCIPVIVAEVEKAMLDGKITADERKVIALKTVDLVCEQFGIKVTGLVRWAISWMIDQVAKKLPTKDIVVATVVKTAVSA